MRLPFRKPRPPTDRELLEAIYTRHRDDFASHLKGTLPSRSSKILVPIDIAAIAEQLGVDIDSVFGRLYYHLDPKYGEPREDGRARKVFFTPRAGSDKNCVNFPLLEAVLASLQQQHDRDLTAVTAAAFSTALAIASLVVSLAR